MMSLKIFRFRAVVVALTILTTWAAAGGVAKSAKPRPAVGTNLNGLSYWSTELPFLDSFKTSSEWISGSGAKWDDGRPLNLDERGWVRSLKPAQVANKVLFHDTAKFSASLPRRFVVRYEGKGRLEYAELAKLVARGDHYDLIEIRTGSGNATVTLTSTDHSDYLRNISLTAEGISARPDEVFNPHFLERLKGYSVLRFMIWMLGESSEDIAASRWNQRPTPQDAIWTVKGAPLEIMIALCNRLGADPWFTLPHAVDDEYVRQFAVLVKKSLDPKLKVYLEYSNEVWNDVYPQTAYARRKGLALGLSQDPNEALLRFYAKRSMEIGSIFQEVLGRERLVRILSFQSDISPEYADEVALSFAHTRTNVDAVAIGPYFGTDLAADSAAVIRTRKMSVDRLFQELAGSSLPKAKAQMRAHAAVAHKYGLPIFAYEGGQHLWNMSGQSAPDLDRLFTTANRDPRMGALYSRYLNDWSETGGGLFMHLLDCGSFEGAGNWGALEYITQPRSQAPKYDALQRFIESGRQ